jgi:hypothetical protein
MAESDRAQRDTVSARAYCRCNSGHYFEGSHCPFDGWSSPASAELAQAVARLRGDHRAVSIEALCRAGVSEPTLARTIVMEFGCDASGFDALTPEGLIVDGDWRPLAALDAAHL